MAERIGTTTGKVPFFPVRPDEDPPFQGITEPSRTPSNEAGSEIRSQVKAREEATAQAAPGRAGSRLGRDLAQTPGAVYDRDQHAWVGMIGKSGDKQKVPWDDLGRFAQEGYSLVEDGRPFKTDDELGNEALLRRMGANQSLGDKAVAAAQTFANTASFGVGSWVAKNAGFEDAVEQIREKQAANPISSGAGAVAATLLPGEVAERAVGKALDAIPWVSRALRGESTLAAAVTGAARGAISNAAAGNVQRVAVALGTDQAVLNDGWASLGIDNLIDAGVGGFLGALGPASRINSLAGTPGAPLANEVGRLARAAPAANKATRVAGEAFAEAGDVLGSAAHAESTARGVVGEKASLASALRQEALKLKTEPDLPLSPTWAKEHERFLREVPEPPVGAPASQRVQYANARGIDSTDVEFASRGAILEPEARARVMEAARLGKMRKNLDALREDMAGMVEMSNTISSRAELAGNTKLARKIDQFSAEVREHFGIRTEYDHLLDGPARRVYIGDADDATLLAGFLDEKKYKALNGLYNHLTEGLRLTHGMGDLGMARTITSDGMASAMDFADDLTHAVRGAADRADFPGIGGEMVAKDQADHVLDSRHGAPTFKPGGMESVFDPKSAAAKALERSEVAPKIVEEMRQAEEAIAIQAPGKAARIKALEVGGRGKGGRFRTGLIEQAEREAQSAMARWRDSQDLTKAASNRASTAREALYDARRPLDAMDEAVGELRTIIQNAGMKPATPAEIRAVERMAGGIFDPETVKVIAVAERHYAATGGSDAVGQFGRSIMNSALRSFAWRVVGGGAQGRMAASVAARVGSGIGSALGWLAGPAKRLTPPIRRLIQDKGKTRTREEEALEAVTSDMQADEALKAMESRIGERLIQLTALNTTVGDAVQKTAMRRLNLLRSELGRSPTSLEVGGKIVPRMRNAEERRRWRLLVQGSRSPAYLYEEISNGMVHPETVRAFRDTWPGLYEAAKRLATLKVMANEYEDPKPIVAAFGIVLGGANTAALQALYRDPDTGAPATPRMADKATIGSPSLTPAQELGVTSSVPHFR